MQLYFVVCKNKSLAYASCPYKGKLLLEAFSKIMINSLKFIFLQKAKHLPSKS